MPKKEKRIDPTTGLVLRQGEYPRSHGGYEYKVLNKETKKMDRISAPTLAELREKEEVFNRDRYSGLQAGSVNITLNNYYLRWKKSKHVKGNVMATYTYMYDAYVRDTIGLYNIKNIKYSTLLSFYNEILDDGRLAMASIENIHTVVRQIFEMATRDDVIRQNPCNGLLAELKKNRPAPKKKLGLTPEEQSRLIEVLKEPEFSKWQPLLLFMLNTGMRIAEVAGLTWDDIDDNFIHVKRNLKYYKKENGRCGFEISSAKTSTSVRDIPLTNKLRDILVLQKEEGNPCTETIDGLSNFVFGNRFGGFIYQGTVNKAIKRIVAYANADDNPSVLLPYFSTHSLRHSTTTNMVLAAVPVSTAAAILGHKDISTTLNIYNMVLDTQKVDAMQRLEDFVEKMDYTEEEKCEKNAK